MKRYLLIAIAAIALLYGGAKGFLWWMVKKHSDSTIAQMKGFANVEYGSIYTSLFKAEVGLDDITIQPMLGQDTITVDSLRYRAPNLLHLISSGTRLNKGKVPESFGVTISQAKIDLESDYAEAFDAIQKQAAALQPQQAEGFSLENSDALGCTDGKFGLNDYKAMGYTVFNLNVVMDAQIDPEESRFEVKMNLSDPGLYSADVTALFELESDDISQMESPPSFDQMELSYSDEGYYQMRNDYCAEKNGGSQERYLERNLARISKEIDGRPNERLAEAYLSFMRHGGVARFKVDPLEPVGSEELKLYATHQLFDLLGIEMSFNNQPFTKEDIAWGERYVAAKTSDGEKVPARSEPGANIRPYRPATTKVAPDPTPQRSYRTVKKSELDGYIGRTIKVETLDGNIREGELQQVQLESITVILRMRSGSLSFPIAKSEIARARILF